MLESLGILLLLTVLGWALFMHVLKPHFGFSFIRTPFRSFLYFALVTALIAYLYLPVAIALYTPSPWGVLSLLLVLLVLNPLIYARAKQRLHEAAHAFRHKDLELLELDTRFLFSKVADVAFQQTVAGILILTLHVYGVPMFWLVIVFALIFALGHLGLLARMPASWAGYFIVSAVVGGAFVPFLILSTPGGFFYAVAFHMLWYALTGAFNRRLEERRLPRRKEA